MTDLTLEDLAGGGSDAAGEAAKAAAEETAESGESLMELVDFLDERGYLKPLMFGIDDTTATDAPATNDAPAADGDTTGVELNAGNVTRLADTIQERVGDVPISRIGEFAAENPERVNDLIKQIPESGGGDGE